MILSDILSNVRRLVEDESSFRWTDKVITEYVVEGVNEIFRKTGSTEDRIPLNFEQGKQVYELNTLDGSNKREHGRITAVHVLPENNSTMQTLQQIQFSELPVSSYTEGNIEENAPAFIIRASGQEGNVDFTDPTGNETYTTIGDIVESTDQAKFGSTSIKSDGTGDEIELLGTGTVGRVGTGDFSADGWFYFNSLTEGMIFSKSVSGINSYRLDLTDATTFTFTFSTNGTATTDKTFNVPTMSTGQWYHVAFERDNGVLRLYIDGVKIEEEHASTEYYYDSTIDLTVGGDFYSELNGYFDEFRFLDGFTEYQGQDFDPPLSRYYVGSSPLQSTYENLSGDPGYFALTSVLPSGEPVDYQILYFDKPASRSTDGDPFGFYVDVNREFVFASDATATAAQGNSLIPVLPKFDRHLTNMVAGFLFLEVNDTSLMQRGQFMLETARKYVGDLAYTNSISFYTHNPNRSFP